MKTHFRKIRFLRLAALALAFAGALAITVPTPLPAQTDIDDVIGTLDKDFSLGNKQELKQSNIETANEQNREDIKITENETPLNLAAGASCIYSGTYTGTYMDSSGTTSITCSMAFSCDESGSIPIPLHFTGSCIDGLGTNYSISGNVMLPSFSLTVTELNSCAAPANTKVGSGSIMGTGGAGTSLSGSLPTTCDTGTTNFNITKN